MITLDDFSSFWRPGQVLHGHGLNRGVSIGISPGDWVAVSGDNGTGKSTFLAGLAGLTPHGRGEFIVHGKALQQQDTYARFHAEVAYLGQQASFPEQTSMSDLKRLYFANRRNLDLETIRSNLLQDFIQETNLPDSSSLDKLPIRVREFLLAVLTVPKLLLIDELGPAVRSCEMIQTFDVYGWLRSKLPYTSVVFVDHDRPTAYYLADWIVHFGDPDFDSEELGSGQPLVLKFEDNPEKARELQARSEVAVERYVAGEPGQMSVSQDREVRTTLRMALRGSNLSFNQVDRLSDQLIELFPYLASTTQIGELSGGQQVVLTAIMNFALLGEMPPNDVQEHLSVSTREKLATALDLVGC